MGRAPRIDIANHYYHILNRANGRLKIFHKDKDYILFENILFNAVEKFQIRLVAYCIMPNHFHLVVYPKKDGEIQKFMQWITLTHTQRLHSINKTIGYGHIYQGRYKSFVVSSDEYLNTLLVYVEQNPLRAKLVKDLKNWKYGSYYKRKSNDKASKLLHPNLLFESKNYDALVHTIVKQSEIKQIRNSVQRGTPYGKLEWVRTIISKFGLESTERKRGRPKKGT